MRTNLNYSYNIVQCKNSDPYAKFSCCGVELRIKVQYEFQLNKYKYFLCMHTNNFAELLRPFWGFYVDKEKITRNYR